MSSQHFFVTEHVSPCQHIREFPHATSQPDTALELAVKEYRPRNAPSPEEEAVTIIAAHANGFPKECYEALWDELASQSSTFKIRSIWIADTANQGASYARNEDKLGDDPNWLDHSRDLLLMVNTFRDRMVAPLIGVAHSMGCAQIVGLSLMHPRLLHSLILVEPIMQPAHPPGPNVAMMSSMRRETWDSRAKAEFQISKNPFFESMDPRVLEAYLAHMLRDLPSGGVSLATPKAQEAWSFLRSNFHALPDHSEQNTPEARARERVLQPDAIPFSESGKRMFTRPEMESMVRALPTLRPRTFYMYGEDSYVNFEEVREAHLAQTGIGVGGSGGRADDCVKGKIFEGLGHLACFENPGEVAAEMVAWIGKDFARWQQEREFWATVDTKKSRSGRKHLSDYWLSSTKEDPELHRQASKQVAKL